MKARELAELLMKYPDYNVNAYYTNIARCEVEYPYPGRAQLCIDGIWDIDNDKKILSLDCSEV